MSHLSRRTSVFEIANRIAAAAVKPYGPALAIARQLRDGTYKQTSENPLSDPNDKQKCDALTLWHQYAKPSVQGYAIGYDEFCSLVAKLSFYW